MKNFITKANLSGGDDSGTATKWGAKESNSVTDELKLAVTTTGQSLAAGTGNDPSPDLLAKALTITAQTAHSYQDSGAADAYVLTRTGSLEQPLSYIDGMRITFITANPNTGASTVNLSSLGSKKILLPDGSTAMSGGEISANEFVDLVYSSSADSSVGAFTTIKQSATETSRGVVELATGAETEAGTDDTRAIHPAGFNSALNALMVGGSNQSWQDVSGSRSTGVTYTNTTDSPIMVVATLSNDSEVDRTILMTLDASIVLIGSTGGALTTASSVSAIIPVSSTYNVTISLGTSTILTWAELR